MLIKRGMHQHLHTFDFNGSSEVTSKTMTVIYGGACYEPYADTVR